MSLSAVQVYYNNCFNLSKTLSIKSEDSADALNNYLIAQYGQSAVDLSQPQTWKYYLNITGQYHPLDTLMYVTSLDNLSTIEFTVSNLANNPVTAAGYAYGTRYYYSLLAQYPEQEPLILGILYPADMAKALSSSNWTILSWPAPLIEDQEVLLIPDLQQWINLYQDRWNVKAFINSDSLYQVAQHAVFYQQLLMKIINLRVKYCKTLQAHSFHIQQYLASTQGLDVFIPFMLTEQVMYLYRNILYLERHPGWRETFSALIAEMITKRNIPLAQYYVRLTQLFNYYKSTLSFDRSAVNPVINTGSVNQFTFEEFLIKTNQAAPGNEIIFNSRQNQILEKIQNSPADSILTKDLESSMYDYSDAVPHRLTNILLNEWLYLSATGQYKAIVTFTDPNTLTDYSLSSLDTFIYMVYLYMKASGISVTTIPLLFAQKVLKPSPPSLQDMTAFADSSYTDAPALALYFQNKRPISQSVTSVPFFYSLCVNIFELGLAEWYQISGNANLYHRAELLTMADYQYIDTPVDTGYTGQSMAAWLSERALPDPPVEASNLQDLVNSIWLSGTGLINQSRLSFSQVQTAMIELVLTLSSYSVQILKNINPTTVILLNWAVIRPSVPQVNVTSEFIVPEDIGIFDYTTQGAQTVDLSNPLSSYSSLNSITQAHDLTVYTYDITATSDMSYQYNPNFNYPVGLGVFMVEVDETSTLGTSYYSQLTAVQANQIPDIY